MKPKTAKDFVKQAMYWNAPQRVYRLNKQEQQSGADVSCPKCKGNMDKENYTKNEKMYRCPSCGFKVPTSKTTTEKIEINIDANSDMNKVASEILKIAKQLNQ